MTSKVIEGCFAHFEFLDLRDSELKSFSYDQNALAKIKAMVDSSFCATIVRGSTIIAIMGFYELWPGTIEVWVLPSIHIPEYAKSYLRHVKRYINNIKKTFKPHRMQTMAINDELHDKWMGFLGFKKEGIIEKYSADKVDYAMWALIP